MILPAQTIRRLGQAGMIQPFAERTVSDGRTFGLGPCTYDVRLKQTLWLWPLWGRLASTVETFDIPNDICAEVKDKSSNARVFVTVQNTLIDPGFAGGLTLELTRHLPWPKRLRAGTPIAQIKFERLEEPTEAPYRGKYYGQSSDPEPVRYEKPAGSKREPFFRFHTIGEGSAYMTRLLIGRFRLHIFHRPDGDPDPHDHPWSFWTFPLTSYVEEVWGRKDLPWDTRGLMRRVRETPDGRLVYLRLVRRFRLHYRPAEYTHRVLGRYNGALWAARAADASDVLAPGKIITAVWRGRESRPWGFLKLRDGRTCWQAGRDYYRGGRHAPCE